MDGTAKEPFILIKEGIASLKNLSLSGYFNLKSLKEFCGGSIDLEDSFQRSSVEEKFTLLLQDFFKKCFVINL